MKRFWISGLCAVLMAFCVSCSDEVSGLGWNLLNDTEGAMYNDTTTVVAYSQLEDTIRTNELTSNMVGSLHDPVFGNSSAAICAQFALGSSTVNFGTHPVVDSVILTLQISSCYGDTNSRVGIRVYQLLEYLSSTDIYYQNSVVAYDHTPLNYTLQGYAVQPHLPVIVDTNSMSPHLRIRLSQAFGQYLLNNQHQLNTSTSFQRVFKGLRIAAVSHTGSTGYMLTTSLTSSLSGITLYYHNENQASAKHTFPCNARCARFTQFEHDYDASTDEQFVAEVLRGQQAVGASTLFVQGTGGVKTVISFPYLLDAFKQYDNRVVINRAELVMSNVAPWEVAALAAPNSLALQGIRKSDGAIAYIPDDEVYTSSAYYGGTYDNSKFEYRFRVTTFVQDLINGTSPLKPALNLVVRGASVRPNRVVLGGTGAENDKRLRLELSYTTY